MKNLLFITLLICSISAFSQHITNINDTKFDVDFENVLTKKLDSDSNSTSFIIWIKKGVKSHKHETHSELIYVIEGEGIITVNGSVSYINPGDYFRIPENTFHSLKVTSKESMKVLSIQSPEFLGQDRILDPEAQEIIQQSIGEK